MSRNFNRKKLNKQQRIIGYVFICIIAMCIFFSHNLYNSLENTENVNELANMSANLGVDNINDGNLNEEDKSNLENNGVTNENINNSSTQNSITEQNLISGKNSILGKNWSSEQTLNVMFFYVGQADCTFIKLGDKCMLIDAGNNEDEPKVSDFLKNSGINKIDYVIGTHNHEDHIGGMDDIVKNFEIENLYLSNVSTDVANYKNVVKQANKKNIKITNPNVGDKFSIGEAECEIMSAENKKDTTPNNSSIVIEMNYKGEKFLFMGDAEKEIEQSRKWNKVNVLKVGHHGSATSSTESFLKEIQPEYAFIEVGKNNSYRLPNKYVMSRLTRMIKNVYRTDLNKTSFLLTCDGNNINVEEKNINLDGNPEE